MGGKHKGTHVHPPTQPPKKPERKVVTFLVRTVSAVAMVAFFWLLLRHPFYLPYFLLFLTTCTFYEVLRTATTSLRNNGHRSSRLLLLSSWTFYVCVVSSHINMSAFLGKLLDRAGPAAARCLSTLSPGLGGLVSRTVDSTRYCISWLFNPLWSFVLGTFILFVALLHTRQPLSASLGMCGWSMSALFLTVIETWIVVAAEKDHAFFFLPGIFVVANDTFAYVWGMLFGRHHLTKLSPAKTWEGYIGAGITTVTLSHFFSLRLVSLFDNSSLLKSHMSADAAIQSATMAAAAVKAATEGRFAIESDKFSRTYIYCMLLATWVSVVGPVGGFLASLAKRHAGIKNFSNLIPGHGGVIDRIDCHILAIVFCTMLYEAFYE